MLGDDPAERDATVAIVIDELDRMSRYVSDLLLLAKAEQPHFLRLEPVDPGELAADILARLSALAPRQWTLDAPRPGVLAGVADSDRLIQAMLNLAANAVQHTVDGDEIGIGVAVESPGGSACGCAIVVPGVDPAIAAGCSAGTPGRQRKAANHHDGVGLGLSIVDAIARAHGGVVEHTPSRGRGHVHDPPSAGTAERRGTVMTRILIAEDEERIVSFLEKGLAGQRVHDDRRGQRHGGAGAGA